jgi:enoyl-CoA hydratase/carnithine racemase
MKYDNLHVQEDGTVATLVIDRPGRRNAIDLAMWRAIASIAGDVAARPDMRALVLRGAGEDFSAGADIGEFETVRRDAASARIYEAANEAAFASVRDLPVPVIAAIDGVCLGGGLGLAAACDLRIATPSASFAIPAGRLGLAYPVDAMADIVAGFGPQLAGHLTFTGSRLDARRALDAGFLLELVERDALHRRAAELAASIADNAPLSVRGAKAAIRAALTGRDEHKAAAIAVGNRTFDSDDYAEGRQAFTERRQPRFRGS